MISFTSVVAAGDVVADDGRLLMLQNLSLDQAETLATMLAVVTNGPVQLSFIGLEGAVDIRRQPGDVQWSGTRNAKGTAAG